MMWLLLACSGPRDDTSGTPSECSDIDGPGGDTGNIPNLLGYWTSAFGSEFYDDGICSVTNLTQTSETWIGAFQVQGSVQTNFYLEYNGAPGERFWGAMDPNGGLTFTGAHAHSGGTMYAHFSGLYFHDQYSDRDIVEGFAYLAMDTDDDAVIDCGVKGSWNATRSGV